MVDYTVIEHAEGGERSWWVEIPHKAPSADPYQIRIRLRDSTLRAYLLEPIGGETRGNGMLESLHCGTPDEGFRQMMRVLMWRAGHPVDGIEDPPKTGLERVLEGEVPGA